MFPIRDTIPSHSPPLVTWMLIAINSLVFLFALTLDHEELMGVFYLFGLVPARYSHPDWALAIGFPVDDYWPFLTSMFLHGGWMHIIGNMWTLWIFGDNVEDRMGRVRFLIFYLLTGLAAGLVHWLTNQNSSVPAVGASGAIAGVLGAYMILFPFSRIITLIPVFFFPLFVQLPAVTYLFFWFLSQMFGATLTALSPGNVGGIAFWAHVGGFVSGIILHRFFLLPKRVRPRRMEPDEFFPEQAWTRH